MGTVTPEPSSTETESTEQTFYDAVGGHETFVRLVDHFYAGVAGDPILRPLYPEEDLGPAAERFRMFLEQYWGGPTTYSQNRCWCSGDIPDSPIASCMCESQRSRAVGVTANGAWRLPSRG